ncbi:MAG: hypothetical protein PHS30_11280, partial [Bacteroidales bacterium]|nr:hypothetical protein [Bacteroidales bacterium]
PGTAKPYGYLAKNSKGCLVTVLNPSQKMEKVTFPFNPLDHGKLLFTDNGFKPVIENNSITLGPEQMAVVGFGQYANGQYDLGIQDDVTIPSYIEPVHSEITLTEKGKAKVVFHYDGKNDLRIIFSQKKQDGHPLRISGGSPPNGKYMSELLHIKAVQNKEEIPLIINYDKQIWSGLSWAVCEIQHRHLKKDSPIHIQYTVIDPNKGDFLIECRIYEVKYL